MFDGSGRKRLRLAIVSTYDELSGIALYTRALKRQLSPFADVTIFELDQSLLRSPHRAAQRLGDKHIAEIAATFDGFDCINLQLDYGTLGKTPTQVHQRLRRLVRSAPALSVTFHTVLGHEQQEWSGLLRLIARGGFTRAGTAMAELRHAHLLGDRVFALLRAHQRMHPVTIITHNEIDARLLRDVYGLGSVEHHPLTFLSNEAAGSVRASARRAEFPLLASLPECTKLIGTFGFLSPHKGFETAVKALRSLPDDYHLVIFGGVHPQEIQPGVPIDPYVSSLLREARVGWEERRAGRSDDVRDRVHFLGVQGDDAFMRAMTLCDAVVLPYQEVRQSSSGVIALAVDLGCRVLASRTQAFLQYARYHPNRIGFFDIGNYAELAGLIRAGGPLPPGEPAFNSKTNAALYVRANRPYADPGESGLLLP